MTGAIAAALKKLAVYIGTDKKALKTVAGIVLGVVLLLVMPIVAVLGIFSGNIEIDTDRLQELIAEQQATGKAVMAQLEERMIAAGYEETQLRQAQALYAYALFSYGKEEGFTEKLVGCFTPEQTDEELITAVNAAFGTNILPEEFKALMEELREKSAEEESASG